MKRAYYIDTYSKANLHEMYNASSLVMFSEIFDSIEFRADGSSKLCVETLLGVMPNNIRYKPIYIFKDNTRFRRFIKQLMAIFYNCYYIAKASKYDLIIINYNTMIAVYLINLATKYLNKKVLVVCHGEMYDLYVQRQTSFLFRMSKLFFTSKKTKVAKGLYFAVLGQFIVENLKNIVSSNIFEKIIAFDLSAIFDKDIFKVKAQDKKVRIGLIGGFRKSKGIELLSSIVSSVKREHSDVEFLVIGSYDLGQDEIKSMGLMIPDGVDGSFLSRKKMTTLISSVDYALYLLPPEIYRFTASASFFDAINCETPLITLKNDFMDYYHNKYGNFGYLFSNIEDIIERLKSISTETSQFDFEQIKEKLNPSKIANEVSEFFLNLVIKK